MDTLSSIEAEYIKNLQKEVYLLELETSFLREQVKKATSIQPKISTQAEKVLQKMKELQSEINTAQLELGKKENSTKFFDAENQAMHKHLQTLSDANTREKLLLMEDVIKLKNLAEIVIQDISHKEAELLGVQQELQRAMNSIKEREHNLHHLENQISEKEDEIRRMHGHVSTMSYDLNSLKSQVETEHSLQRERWKEFSNILTAYKSPAK
ncbi:uncharacterized protein [Lepidochelys kempii]